MSIVKTAYVQRQLNRFYLNACGMSNADYSLPEMCSMMIDGPVYVNDELVPSVSEIQHIPKTETRDANILNECLDIFYLNAVKQLMVGIDKPKSITLELDSGVMCLIHD